MTVVLTRKGRDPLFCSVEQKTPMNADDTLMNADEKYLRNLRHIRVICAFDLMVKRGEAATGAAWLSSARAVRRSLNWGNERNPYRQLQVFDETALPFAH